MKLWKKGINQEEEINCFINFLRWSTMYLYINPSSICLPIRQKGLIVYPILLWFLSLFYR